MDTYDDDDDEFLDVPDLDSRTWRHPSEVAAGLAAIAPPPPSEEPNISNGRQPHLVGAVVAAAMCTMGLVFGGVLQPGTMLNAKQVQIDPALGLKSGEAVDAMPQALNHSPTGLFTGSGASGTFIARSVVIDNMILTSASALAGRRSATFRLDLADSSTTDEPEILEIPVEVLRLSPEHDLAILALPGHAVNPFPVWLPEADKRATGNLDEVVLMDDCSNKPSDGEVRFTNVTTTSSDGVGLNGLVQTSIPALDCAAGSPITNTDGEIVGMATSTATPQTFFVPASQISEELALAIA